MTASLESSSRFNKEVNQWLEMVDSVASVITASSTLLRIIHNNLGEGPIYSTPPYDYQEKLLTNLTLEPDLLPHQQHPFDNIREKFKHFPSKPTNSYLDEQYRRAKQAIFKRYKPPTKITTLYSRENANIDFIDDKFNEDLYNMSGNASERGLYQNSSGKIEDLILKDKNTSAEGIYMSNI